MKFLLFVAIVAVLWIAIRGLPGFTDRDATAALHSEGYLEVRAVLEAGSTELEMVIVEERPLISDCKSPARAKQIIAACPDDVKCALTRVECKPAVDQRYLNMLGKRPTHLHFAHMEHSDGELHRNGVLVVWGMTVDDSRTLCRSLIGDKDVAAQPNTTWTCI
jgi:hypothetical protein